jgi:hypothetical protein
MLSLLHPLNNFALGNKTKDGALQLAKVALEK